MSLRTRALAYALVFGGILSGCGGGGGGNAGGPASPSAGASSGAERGASADDGPAGPPRQLDCGDFSTCAVASDGGVHCWGRDKEGELGDGKGDSERLRRALVPELGNVKTIALASRFGCALLEDGRVKCWGSGRIANDGKPFTEAKPTLVSGVDRAEELVASGAVACARAASGVVCWGTDDKSIAAPPSGKLTQIATGFTHACAIDGGGAVQCWGPGDWGGKGVFAKPGITGAVQVATGDRHACIVTKSKTVQCWGMNDAGQLGIKSDMEAHKKPVTVSGLSGVERLIAGEASTCALLGDGSVRCWGANAEGELGFGTRSSDERPARVSALSDVDQLCLATAHGCALTRQNKLLCWGGNAFGQLGDGTKERRAAPTPVVW